MTTTCTQLGIVSTKHGLRFSWGPNDYVVKRNIAGNVVWKRWNDRAGWWRRVDLTACGGRYDSLFSRKMLACVEQLQLEV